MKNIIAIFVLISNIAIAEKCIDISGRYFFSGSGEACRLDLGERYWAYPIPFVNSGDKFPHSISANTEIEFRQIGCETILLRYRDAMGSLSNETISLLPDPSIHGRVSFKENSISWKERQAY